MKPRSTRGHAGAHIQIASWPVVVVNPINMPTLSADYWQNRYETRQTGWDVGHATEPLRRIIDSLPDTAMRILVPGAGNGYEVEYLWQRGFRNVTVIDLARAPLERLAARLPEFPAARLIEGDYFDHRGQYDVQLEQTFFCALDPALRPAYVRQAHRLLAPGGRIQGVLFDRTFERPGPPFGGSAAAYRILFAPYFRLLQLQTSDHSESTRQEVIINFERREVVVL